MADEKKRYRLKDGVGKHRNEKGELVAAGTVLELTESQAAGLKGKVEALDGAVTGDVAGTNDTPNATARDGKPGQNPELGQQESAAAKTAVGDPNKATAPKEPAPGAATPTK